MTEEELITEAKRRYPIGTVFKSPENDETYTVTKEGFYIGETPIKGENKVLAQLETHGEYVYFNNTWAKIISLPTPKITQKQKQTILNLIKEI
ncbi:MAG: hypothetical protein E6R13_06345 [Spirochaetes bacterium]|nr:MAG: hypothetical protein E6R13_06345 [Spirochaetota bacterium]